MVKLPQPESLVKLRLTIAGSGKAGIAHLFATSQTF